MKISIGPNPYVQPNTVFVVGSYDTDGRPNLMTVAWGSICCSKPPCIAITPAKKTKTYQNILHSKAFTINIPSISHVRETDYVGIYSGKKENKFESLGLTPIKGDLVNAPYADEFFFILECKVIYSLQLGSDMQLFIGEILDIKAEKHILGENGLPDIRKVQPFVYDEIDRNYFAVGELIAKAFSIGKKT
jgi:flavin reductase (DIM6/NTAB) family NADH-FMN oxidoreductase RutF